ACLCQAMTMLPADWAETGGDPTTPTPTTAPASATPMALPRLRSRCITHLRLSIDDRGRASTTRAPVHRTGIGTWFEPRSGGLIVSSVSAHGHRQKCVDPCGHRTLTLPAVPSTATLCPSRLSRVAFPVAS